MSKPRYAAELAQRILDDRNHTGLRSTITKGALTETEDRAYGYLRMPSSIANYRPARVAILRTAATIAATRCPQADGVSLGRAMRTLASRRGEESRSGEMSGMVTDRMLLLVSQPAEQAVETVRALVTMASEKGGIGIDHLKLMETMSWWETGDHQRDTVHRRQVLLAFHSPTEDGRAETAPAADDN